MRKRKALKRLFLLLLFLITVLGGLILARLHLQDNQRKSAKKLLIQMIQEGQSEIILPDVPEVSGEVFDEIEEISPEYLSPEKTDAEAADEALEEKDGYWL